MKANPQIEEVFATAYVDGITRKVLRLFIPFSKLFFYLDENGRAMQTDSYEFLTLVKVYDPATHIVVEKSEITNADPFYINSDKTKKRYEIKAFVDYDIEDLIEAKPKPSYKGSFTFNLDQQIQAKLTENFMNSDMGSPSESAKVEVTLTKDDMDFFLKYISILNFKPSELPRVRKIKDALRSMSLPLPEPKEFGAVVEASCVHDICVRKWVGDGLGHWFDILSRFTEVPRDNWSDLINPQRAGE